MNKPCYLTTGDKIRIISPAGNVSVEKTEQGIELLRNEGFEVQHGNHVFERFFQFAGTDEQRLDDLQEALDDESCKAIICSRGGYGTIRLISRLDFSKFCKNPKWLVGFSDITILHSILQGLGVKIPNGLLALATLPYYILFFRGWVFAAFMEQCRVFTLRKVL